MILTQGSQQKPSYLVPRPKASNTHFLHHRCAHILMTLFLAAVNLCTEWGLCFLKINYFTHSGCFRQLPWMFTPLLSPATLQLHQYGKGEGVSMPISGREAGRTGGGKGRFLITPPCTVMLVAVKVLCECEGQAAIVYQLCSLATLFPWWISLRALHKHINWGRGCGRGFPETSKVLSLPCFRILLAESNYLC